MNVGDLRRMIADLPDRLPVVVPAADHSYALATVETATATRTSPRMFDEYEADAPSEARTCVLVVS